VELGNDAAFVASSLKTQKAGENCHARQYFFAATYEQM
jgi:hypothetical protein